MITRCSVSTNTVATKSGVMSVSCKINTDDSGNVLPEIYGSTVLEEDGWVNNVFGRSGELIISSNDVIASKLEDGQLLLKTQADNEDLYEVQDGSLVYTHE